jgi:hypothetical protein
VILYFSTALYVVFLYNTVEVGYFFTKLSTTFFPVTHMDFAEIWQRMLFAHQKHFWDGSDMLYMRDIAELG